MTSPLLVLLEGMTAAALVGGVLAGLWSMRALDRREQAGLIGLALLALAVRLHAPAAPHDVNFRAWGAYSEGAIDVERGFGFPAWGRVWHAVIPGWEHDERWLFDVAALAGAAAPLALFAWLRTRGATVAWLAATLFAVATPHVRFSHTDAQQIPALTFGILGLAAWAWHGRSASWVAASLATLATTVAACGRVEWAAWPVLAWVVLVMDGLPRHPATWIGWAATLGVTAWHVWSIFHGDGSWVTGGYAHGVGTWLWEHPLFTEGPVHLIWLDPAFTPLPLAIATLAGVTVGPGSAARRASLAGAALALSCVVPTWTPAHADAFAIARYQLAALPFVLTLAAGAFAALLARAPGWPSRAWIATGVAVLGGLRLPLNWAPTTQSAEYAFVRDSLPALPTGCTVVIDTWTTDAGLAFPTHLVAALRPDLRMVGSDAWTPDLSVCTLYYRAASCSAHAQELSTGPVRGDFCPGLGEGFTLSPAVTRGLPRRQWVYDLYDVDPVPVGFFYVGTEAGR